MWDAWLARYVGRTLAAPAGAATRDHPERLRPPGAATGAVRLASLTDEQLVAKLDALGVDASGARGALIARLDAALRSDSVPY